MKNPQRPRSSVRYSGIVRERSALPGKFGLRCLGWAGRADDQKRWSALNQAPDAFSMGPPAGAQIKDLVQTLEQLAEDRGEHLPQ